MSAKLAAIYARSASVAPVAGGDVLDGVLDTSRATWAWPTWTRAGRRRQNGSPLPSRTSSRCAPRCCSRPAPSERPPRPTRGPPARWAVVAEPVRQIYPQRCCTLGRGSVQSVPRVSGVPAAGACHTAFTTAVGSALAGLLLHYRLGLDTAGLVGPAPGGGGRERIGALGLGRITSYASSRLSPAALLRLWQLRAGRVGFLGTTSRGGARAGYVNAACRGPLLPQPHQGLGERSVGAAQQQATTLFARQQKSPREKHVAEELVALPLGLADRPAGRLPLVVALASNNAS